MENYCLYRHIRLDKNEVFYIGIGSERRSRVKSGRNKIWKNIVNKSDWKSEIMLDNLTLEEAKEKEIFFIRLYGRINTKTGTLANMTDGGDGTCGMILSDEAKRKIGLKSSQRTPAMKGKGKWIGHEDDIIKDIQLGFTEKMIKEKYNCSNFVIHRIKRKNDIKIPDKIKEYKWSKYENDIYNDLESGMTIKKVKEKYGCNNVVIYKVKTRYKKLTN